MLASLASGKLTTGLQDTCYVPGTAACPTGSCASRRRHEFTPTGMLVDLDMRRRARHDSAQLAPRQRRSTRSCTSMMQMLQPADEFTRHRPPSATSSSSRRSYSGMSVRSDLRLSRDLGGGAHTPIFLGAGRSSTQICLAPAKPELLRGRTPPAGTQAGRIIRQARLWDGPPMWMLERHAEGRPVLPFGELGC
eukprot:TRINITY_DN27791_c0_g1_i2.p1 TRINITY_DN27791_c0_g1~~TRINITY_DN27791_c0_g1_i2.p1  ORF type:complete len:193 (-),score=21.09 TRINITY_DN27791_c0_g1_i2:220-798(-)